MTGLDNAAARRGPGLPSPAGGSSPTPPLQPKDLWLAEIPHARAREFLRAHHYLGRACRPASVLCFGVHAGPWFGPELVGVLMFTLPVARLEDQAGTLELHRMALLDRLPRNSESRCLGVAVRLVRRLRPGIRRLVAYADPAAGHRGTVYAAAGWRLVRMMEALAAQSQERKGWLNRPGSLIRHDPRPKAKWERLL